MDNELHLERFAEDREGWLGTKPGPGDIITHPKLHLLFVDVRREYTMEMFFENYEYMIGRKARSELTNYEDKLAAEYQRLLIDEIDFSNSVQGFKFDNGRWIWPPEAIYQMHKATAERNGRHVRDVYQNVELLDLLREKLRNGRS